MNENPSSGKPLAGQTPDGQFTYRQNGVGRMTVELGTNFTHEDWDPFSSFVRNQINAGIVHWFLDLRKLQLLNSLLIGAIIGMNMVVQSNRGSLHLIVTRDSRISQLINMSKINRIIPMDEM